MTKLIILFCITFSITQVNGQALDSFYFKNEISISINQTNVEDNNTENKIGFGIADAFIFRPLKRINILFGIEYNRTSQFKKHLYQSHFFDYENTTCHLNSISIPLSARINFFKKTKLFIETGAYFESNFHTELEGFDSTNSKKTVVGSFTGYGLSIGLGLKFQILKHEYSIKTDYKYSNSGLNLELGDIFYNSFYRLIIGFKI